MLKFKYPPKTLRKIYRYHEYFNAKTIYNLKVLQNKLMRRAKRIGLDVTEEDISDEITDAINFVNSL